ncbi:velvet factor-domain-containing protein [Polychytrium aggregatum]|uniref:velvet factor-domain-containing protein n=1 Tax=Polychytrium aggregatum TaxID=110093 RepID=UPI0022FECF66|nr:velvet factor-domain-containing protein [Polychytrium aggregatum]KAI9203546.1 velvet factor-domain-containing protein [Polychytrium aggregatum]
MIPGKPSDLTNDCIPTLFGTTISQSYFLKDERGQPGVFFIFDHLCVRIEGHYRLKFFLYNLVDPQRIGSISSNPASSTILAEAVSDPFESYNWKDFPGMDEDSKPNNTLWSFTGFTTCICAGLYP